MVSAYHSLVPSYRCVATALTALLVWACYVFASCTSNTASSSKETITIKETQTGLASYYGRAFEGEETASGETFRSREMVAAHPTYPLGTVARITNLENGGAVHVRIIDRGPTDENVAEGVIIDLSKGAAEKLGMVKDGRVRVRVEVLQWGTNEYKPEDSL
jgi:rare lipoprotein A